MAPSTLTHGTPNNAAVSESKTFDRLAEWQLFALIIGTTYLQKFSIYLGDGQFLPISLIILLLVTMVGFVTGHLKIHPVRSVLVLLLVGGLSLSQLLGGSVLSLAAMLLVFIIHIPYAFGLAQKSTRPKIELLFFQKVCLVLGFLGIAQYFLQFVIGWQNAFFLDASEISGRLVVLHAPYMNSLNAMSFGSNIYKSNGVLLNEASVFCQYLALALIIELVYFRNIMRMAVYTLGLIVTFSGTGLIILFVIIPLYMLKHRHFMLLFLLILAAITAPFWAHLVGIDYQLSRAGEFTSEHSSGYARFISPFRLIKEFSFPEVSKLLFGNGAGSIYRTILIKVDYAAWDPTWGKLIFEYGIMGGLFYLPLAVALFVAPRRSAFLKMALVIAFFFMGGNLAAPYYHMLVLALLVWPSDSNSAPEFSVVPKERNATGPSSATSPSC